MFDHLQGQARDPIREAWNYCWNES